MASPSARKRKRLQRAWDANAQASAKVLKTRAGADLARQYNGASRQRERIAHYLRLRGDAGALASEIQQACSVPCVTKRISEMRRREGIPITTRPEMVACTHGLNQVSRYFLLELERRQGELDLEWR